MTQRAISAASTVYKADRILWKTILISEEWSCRNASWTKHLVWKIEKKSFNDLLPVLLVSYIMIGIVFPRKRNRSLSTYINVNRPKKTYSCTEEAFMAKNISINRRNMKIKYSTYNWQTRIYSWVGDYAWALYTGGKSNGRPLKVSVVGTRLLLPERKVSDVKSLGQCIPWMMRPLDDASLGWCVPWMMRPLDESSLGWCVL